MTKEWGPPTWYLFHTLAEKVIDSDFDKMKPELITMIKLICSNLPCPDCSHHATMMLNNSKLASIKNKDDLKQYMLWFHNQVNIKLNTRQFTMEELNSKYSKANTQKIIQYFLQIWSKKTNAPRLMSHALHKSRAVTHFNNWWKTNYIHFRS